MDHKQTLERAIQDMKSTLDKTYGEGAEYTLITPVDFKPKQVGNIFGVSIVADPLCPKDTWYMQYKGRSQNLPEEEV